jgi:hypothetical protein
MLTVTGMGPASVSIGLPDTQARRLDRARSPVQPGTHFEGGGMRFSAKPADNNELMDVIRTTLNPVWPGTAAAALPGH